MALTKRGDEYHSSMRRHQGHAGPLQGPGAVPQTHRQVEYICSATPVKKVRGQDLQLGGDGAVQGNGQAIQLSCF